MQNGKHKNQRYEGFRKRSFTEYLTYEALRYVWDYNA
jgi:hypothetical protein